MNPLMLRLRLENGEELLPVPRLGKGFVFLKNGEEVAAVKISTKFSIPFQKTTIYLDSNSSVTLLYFGRELISTKRRPTGGVARKRIPFTAEVLEAPFPFSLFLPPAFVKPYRFFGKSEWISS